MRITDRITAVVMLAQLFGGIYFGLSSWKAKSDHTAACSALYQQYFESVLDNKVSGDTSSTLGATWATFCTPSK